MSYYPINNFKFSGIMESDDLQHKYLAILQNINTFDIKILPFGNIYNTHYNDVTGLAIYSHLDTFNLDDRRNYILNNQLQIKGGYYSSIYFEMRYLYKFDTFLINSSI